MTIPVFLYKDNFFIIFWLVIHVYKIDSKFW